MLGLLAGLGAGVGSFFGSRSAGGSGKVPGVPTPGHQGSMLNAALGAGSQVRDLWPQKEPRIKSAGEQGTDYRNFMNEAYPGTTPWERLGATGPYGS